MVGVWKEGKGSVVGVRRVRPSAANDALSRTTRRMKLQIPSNGVSKPYQLNLHVLRIVEKGDGEGGKGTLDHCKNNLEIPCPVTLGDRGEESPLNACVERQ